MRKTPAILGLIVALIITLTLLFSLQEPEQPGFAPRDYEQQELETFTSPLYFTIVVHNEEDTSKCTSPKANAPDYDGDEKLLLHFTNSFRELGEIAQQHGAKINFGTDWTFSNGVELYDPTFYTDMEAMGHEIDAHAHQSCILYSEVREDIIDAGGTPTKVASGMEEENIYKQMEYFDKYYPYFEILWGVAKPGHGDGEEVSGWVWRPSREEWLEHDPEGKYIHIGHGEQANNLNYVEEAVDARKGNHINTYAVFISVSEFLAEEGTLGIPEDWTTTTDDEMYWENKLEWWDNFLTEIDGLEDVEYASLTEIATTFVANEHNLDFDFDTENHPRSTLSMTEKNSRAGYPVPQYSPKRPKTLLNN